MSEPMITIKKADGTFAKVTLSEFKKMKAAPKPAEPAKIVGQPTPARLASESVAGRPTPPKRGIDEGAQVAHRVALHHPTPHHAPAHIKSHTEHAKTVHHPKPMSRADAGSPLEEKLPPPTAGSRLMAGKITTTLFSPKREKQVEEVLGKLGFSVAPEVSGRLKSLVLAKLKDIKSEDETSELLARSIKNGGLGLTEQQVEKIIKACREVEGLENTDDSSVPALKGMSGDMSLMVEPPELPMVIDPTLTLPLKREGVVATPLFKEGQGEVNAKSLAGSGQQLVSKLVGSASANEPIFKLDTKPVMKQSMQDVTASSNEMGPVEEIKSITLTDFRRLSGNPEEAAKRLQQKMFNLQEESFVWYLDALSAYHTSPLYSEYMQAVCQSLAERKSLANILNMKNSIKLNEAMALVEMEKSL